MSDPLFDEWRAYEKLLDNDYMYHRSLFSRLKNEIQEGFSEPVAILDLGCGDASPIRPMLEALDVRLYCGVDQSETALSMAETNLAPLDMETCLYPGDLVDILQKLTGSFDVVVASFAFHHLETRALKQQVLSECRRVLHPQGMMAVIDVFQEENESRDEYLHRWVSFARQSYTALNHAEMTSLVDHVNANDYPETLSAYRAIGQAAGFGQFKVLMQDKEEFNHLVTLIPGL
jgi:ubiquinone/menaquinone biosynthesis C-methylase UbiE